MDDLYDNLENYHDDKIIDELRNENKDLKTKLEEYSNALVCLQNDFDKLNSEYKKLEMNYSSLLRTARAEIERKSEMIKSLNLEKDVLVIKALHSTGTNILKTRRHNLNDFQKTSKRYGKDSECGDESQQKKDQKIDSNNLENNHRNHRDNPRKAQSESTISSMENNSNFSEESRKTNSYHKNTLHKPKEHHIKNFHTEDDKSSTNNKEQKNFNTRKFMAMSRVEPIYSSDDDFEEFNFNNIRKASLKEDTGYKSRSNRDKYLSPSRDLYKSSSHKFMDHDKYRYNRYESGQKYRRHSPQKYKGTYSKQNKLRNQTSNKYSCSQSRDRRFISERENYFDNPRYLSHHHDSSIVKHRISNELEEPLSKRQKLEESSTNVEKSIITIDREKVHFEKHNVIENLSELLSCQSPDYDNVDSTLPQHVVKEIKDTATMSLDDPRVTSQKYVLKNVKEKKYLSAVFSENIEIKPINVSTWDIPNIKKFTLLEKLNHNQLPTVKNKDLVSEIHIKKDKTTSNAQLESEEIQKDVDNCNLQNDSKICEKTRNKSQDQSEIINNLKVINSDKLENIVTDTCNHKIPKHDQKCDTASASKYECSKSKEKCSKVNTMAQSQSYDIKKGSDDPKHIEIIQKTRNFIILEKAVLAMSTLEDDLELSDEASENKNLQKDKLICSKKTKKILSRDKTCTISAELNKNQSDLPQVKDKHSESKKMSDSVNSKNVELKEFNQANKKTPKVKNKILQKEMSTEFSEQNKELHTILKQKDRDKHVVSMQTKNKFSDLFGDSSSLITPDDLGIPSPEIQPLGDKYVSVFDNTQDAVDLNVEDLHKTQCTTTKINTFPAILKELSTDTKVIERKVNNDLNIVPEDDDKNTKDNNSSLKTCNEIKPEIFNSASEVVKTLIISSGVQPNTVQYVQENNKQNSEITDTEFPNMIHGDKVNLKKCVLSNIKALATSTPHKSIHENVSVKISDLNSPNYGDNISEETNVSSNTSNSSKHNQNEIKNEADIPDLRLIVRRRRKIIKKP